MPALYVSEETTKVYAAEVAASGSSLRRFRRFVDVTNFVDEVVTSDWWDEQFPSAPVEVHVERRSRNATFSAANCIGDGGVLWIVDGVHWSIDVVLHELAHLAVEFDPDHGAEFRRVLLVLWRRYAGFFAWASLRYEFDAAGLPVSAGGGPRRR